MIIAKNILRILFFQFPEWSEDFKDWKKEMYIKCTYNGIQLSEKEFPKNWLRDGIQIKILFPFRLKPWHRSKLQSPPKNSIKKKGQKKKHSFLTVWGMEAELPFGSPRKQVSFFEPIFKELEKKIRKLKKKSFRILRVLKERTKLFLNKNISKERKEWVIKKTLFLKEIIKELSKSILLFKLKEIERTELNETKKKKEQDSIIRNRMIPGSSIPIRSMNWSNYSFREKKMKDLTDRTNTTIKKIEKIRKDKKKEFLTTEISIITTKISYDDKKFESPQNLWQILKKRNVRFIRKSHHFFKFLVEKIYIDILLCMINIPRLCMINLTRINAQLFLESIKKLINKYIYKNETNKSRIHFISTIKKPLSNINNKNGKDLSYLSQAYVFYKLSQTQVINLSKFRPIFQYQGTSHFLKNEIRDHFVGAQGIFNSELRKKNLPNYGINQWKKWLRGYYQYDLYPIRWSRLVPKKWRNRVTQGPMVQNKNLDKCHSYKKNGLIQYKKQNDFETYYSVPNKKENLKKQYIYDLLSYKSINYEDKKDLYIYELPVQVKKNQEISYNYNNYNTHKRKFFDILEAILINNYLVEDDIIDMEKNLDRKYFHWRILNFCISDIESWITSTNSKKNTKKNYNYERIDKIYKKVYFTIHQERESNRSNKKKHFFYWMRMNEEILSRSISNLEGWFFPESLILYNVYKINPWIIPIKLLLLSLNVNDTFSENQNISGNKKRDIFISSNEKTLELENINKVEKELARQNALESALSTPPKYVEEDYMGSDMKKRKNKKQYKKNTEAELDFFLKRYLRFQLRWDDYLNKKIINNMKVYCLLLRLINPREIVISSIQSGELSLDILIVQKDLTLTELTKRGILIIEPVRLSVKNDGQFIMYQIIGIGISLVHKNKHKIQMNQRYQEKSYADNRNFAESIPIHQQTTENRHKNNYDLLVPENILSPRGRRELRILISFNSRNINHIHRNTAFYNANKSKNCAQVLYKSKHLDRYKKKLIKLKFFLWPNYRLEDLACMNRYWFDTTNGSRFSMVRIHMYPQLQIR